MNAAYLKFQAKLYPVLPFLILQAASVRKKYPVLPSISEKLVWGKGPRKVLIIGESTAAGVGASSTENTLSGHLHQLLGEEFTVFNLGKNGLRTSEASAHFQVEINAFSEKFEGIFIFLGANDCFRLTHPRRFRRDLETLIQSLSSSFEPNWIYLADIPPVHLFPAFPSVLKSFLDQQRSFLHREMSLLSENQPNLIFSPIALDLSPDFFSSDQIHPGDVGYQRIADFTHSGLSRSGFLV